MCGLYEPSTQGSAAVSDQAVFTMAVSDGKREGASCSKYPSFSKTGSPIALIYVENNWCKERVRLESSSKKCATIAEGVQRDNHLRSHMC